MKFAGSKGDISHLSLLIGHCSSYFYWGPDQSEVSSAQPELKSVQLQFLCCPWDAAQENSDCIEVNRKTPKFSLQVQSQRHFYTLSSHHWPSSDVSLRADFQNKCSIEEALKLKVGLCLFRLTGVSAYRIHLAVAVCGFIIFLIGCCGLWLTHKGAISYCRFDAWWRFMPENVAFSLMTDEH